MSDRKAAVAEIAKRVRPLRQQLEGVDGDLWREGFKRESGSLSTILERLESWERRHAK